MAALGVSWAKLLFVFALLPSFRAQQCTSNDFSVIYNGVPFFTVTSDNHSCICRSFVSSGLSQFDGAAVRNLVVTGNASIPALDAQAATIAAQAAVISNHTAQLAAQAAQIATLQTQIARLMGNSNGQPAGYFGVCNVDGDCQAGLRCSGPMRRCLTDVGRLCSFSQQCWDAYHCVSGVCRENIDCAAILRNNPLLSHTSTGVQYARYNIDIDGFSGPAAPFNVMCDMQTDGGGWTMFAYAGTIEFHKSYTVGGSNSTPNCNFFPVWDTYGTIDPAAQTTRTTFSRLDLWWNRLQPTSEIMMRRTSNASNIFIWPVSQPSAYTGPPAVNGTNGTKFLPNVTYLRLSNSGPNGFKTVTETITVYNQAPLPTWTGYNWNTPANENCDLCGRNYSSALNHRSLFYTEQRDLPCSLLYPGRYPNGGGSETQWYHGTPLSLTESTIAANNFQDFEFWLRV